MMHFLTQAWYIGLFIQCGLLFLVFSAAGSRARLRGLTLFSLAIIVPGILYWISINEQVSHEARYWDSVEHSDQLVDTLQSLINEPSQRQWMPEVVTRARAIQLLFALPPAEASAAVAALTEHPDPSVRALAARQIGVLGDISRIAVLGGLTVDDNRDVSLAAINALASPRFADGDRTSRELLDRLPGVLRIHPANALELIARVGDLGRPSALTGVGGLDELTTRSDLNVAQAARRAIASYRNPGALPYIAKLLDDTSAPIRAAALNALRDISRGSFSAVSGYLVAGLSSDKLDVRGNCYAILLAETHLTNGYNPATPAGNAGSIKQWEAWLDTSRANEAGTISQLAGDMDNAWGAANTQAGIARDDGKSDADRARAAAASLVKRYTARRLVADVRLRAEKNGIAITPDYTITTATNSVKLPTGLEFTAAITQMESRFASLRDSLAADELAALQGRIDAARAECERMEATARQWRDTPVQ
ncbi:MAG: HEAT repeat domain-containing protein, partial [Planctomycetota bacterium]